jgi:hypothetical protein
MEYVLANKGISDKIKGIVKTKPGGKPNFVKQNPSIPTKESGTIKETKTKAVRTL